MIWSSQVVKYRPLQTTIWLKGPSHPKVNPSQVAKLHPPIRQLVLRNSSLPIQYCQYFQNNQYLRKLKPILVNDVSFRDYVSLFCIVLCSQRRLPYFPSICTSVAFACWRCELVSIVLIEKSISLHKHISPKLGYKLFDFTLVNVTALNAC